MVVPSKMGNFLADILEIPLVVSDGYITGSGKFKTKWGGLPYSMEILSSFMNTAKGSCTEAGVICAVMGDLVLLIAVTDVGGYLHGTASLMDRKAMSSTTVPKHSSYLTIKREYTNAIRESYAIDSNNKQWDKV